MLLLRQTQVAERAPSKEALQLLQRLEGWSRDACLPYEESPPAF